MRTETVKSGDKVKNNHLREYVESLMQSRGSLNQRDAGYNRCLIVCEAMRTPKLIYPFYSDRVDFGNVKSYLKELDMRVVQIIRLDEDEALDISYREGIPMIPRFTVGKAPKEVELDSTCMVTTGYRKGVEGIVTMIGKERYMIKTKDEEFVVRKEALELIEKEG